MPKVIGGSPYDPWESRVLEKLKRQLPRDWIVLVNISWATRRGHYVRDGQSDFVVLVPRGGLCVIEVKGSKAVQVTDGGIWQRHEPQSGWVDVSPSPFEQATSNMHELSKLACAHLGTREFPGRFAYLVAYPNGEIRRRPDTYDVSTFVSQRDMEDLPSRIRGSLNARGDDALGNQFTVEIATRVARALSNQSFKVEIVDTSDDAQADAAEIDKLTRQQLSALRGVFDFPSVAVIGPAGAGKTLIAMWRLKALISDGRHAMYVCFNKNLAEWLRISNPEIADHIHSLHRMFTSLVGAHGPGAGVSVDEYFDSILPNEAFDYANALAEAEKYDVIIVDEGQDLGEASELALRELLKSAGSQWLLFADEKQNLYQAGVNRYVTAEAVFRLHHNCRNTARVNASTNNYCEHKIESIPEMTAGVVPQVEYPGGAQAQAQAAWRICREMRTAGTVAVLSPVRLENSVMADMRHAFGLQLSTELESLGRPNMVLFSTIKAFKGIEASAVIVVDVDVPGTTISFSTEDLYVACTRPTSRLVLICKSGDARQWFQRRALVEP